MNFTKKSKSKPFYKQFIKLRENVQNSKKILKFKKQKWNQYVKYIKRTFKKYKKFKPKNQLQYTVVPLGTNKWTSYQKGKFRQILHTYKRFKLFYGGFSEKKIKILIKQTLNKNFKKNLKIMFLKLFESRLDTVLYRAKFSTSIKGARQLIFHGKIQVNNIKIRSQSYFLKPGDLISINFKHNKLIQKNISNSNIWPIPPKYLIINYKILQIIFGIIDETNFAQNFTLNLNLEKLLVDYLRH